MTVKGRNRLYMFTVLCNCLSLLVNQVAIADQSFRLNSLVI